MHTISRHILPLQMSCSIKPFITGIRNKATITRTIQILINGAAEKKILKKHVLTEYYKIEGKFCFGPSKSTARTLTITQE